MLIILSAVTLVILTIIVLNRSQFGAKRDLHAKLKESKQFSANKNRFVNNQAHVVTFAEYDAKISSSLKRYIFGKNQKPGFALPEIKPNWADFLQKSDMLKFIWFGHSSFVLNIANNILLFDPVFSKSASPFPFVTKRFQKPVASLEELPPIDYIVLSHDHYDHLDMHTIKFFKNTNTKFIVPLGVGEHLKYWGIAEPRITELDWWQKTQFGNLEFILTPAQHFSGRKLIDYNHTLWGSWVVRDTKHSIYFSGDSGYAKHFNEIGEKYGPFDVVFIENGQYDPAWRDVHMLPEDVIQAVKDLRAKIFMPIHWGMFCLAPHQWFDPIETIYQLAKEFSIDIFTPKLGQLVVSEQMQTHTWWRELVNYEQVENEKTEELFDLRMIK